MASARLGKAGVEIGRRAVLNVDVIAHDPASGRRCHGESYNVALSITRRDAEAVLRIDAVELGVPDAYVRLLDQWGRARVVANEDHASAGIGIAPNESEPGLGGGSGSGSYAIDGVVASADLHKAIRSRFGFEVGT